MAAENLVAAAQSGGVVRILNCMPSPRQEEDWSLLTAVNAGLVSAAGAIPSNLDLRESWWTIGDQGSTGSCVGWALADSVLRWHFVMDGTLSETERMSPRFLWMAAKEVDEFITEPTTFIEWAGTSLKAALNVAMRFGSVRDSTLPFASTGLFAGRVNTFYAIAAQLRIVGYVNLGADLDQWRQWLAFDGPILTRLIVDETWNQADQTDGALDAYQNPVPSGGHAAALVGYTPDRFIVRNSWGGGWGDAGFAYASLDYTRDAFTEAYGVTTAVNRSQNTPVPTPWRP